ncbi:hypothetical protein D3C71_2139750 [compost metagenome]
MPHLATELVAYLAVTHFVVAPEGAVHQQAVGLVHPRAQVVVHLAQTGGIEKRATAEHVLDQQTNVVTGVWVMAMR